MQEEVTLAAMSFLVHFLTHRHCHRMLAAISAGSIEVATVIRYTNASHLQDAQEAGDRRLIK